MKAFMVVAAGLLALIAVVALAGSAISLRTMAEEEKSQTKCARATAYATAIGASRNFGGGTSATGIEDTDWTFSSTPVAENASKYLDRLITAC